MNYFENTLNSESETIKKLSTGGILSIEERALLLNLEGDKPAELIAEIEKLLADSDDDMFITTARELIEKLKGESVNIQQEKSLGNPLI